jgi:hypothetical protein
MNDEDLRTRFSELREHDRRTAPAFVRPVPRKRSSTVWIGGAVALAAAAVLAVWVIPGDPEVAPKLRHDEPLGFLLAPPSASVIVSREPYDSMQEGL